MCSSHSPSHKCSHPDWMEPSYCLLLQREDLKLHLNLSAPLFLSMTNYQLIFPQIADTVLIWKAHFLKHGRQSNSISNIFFLAQAVPGGKRTKHHMENINTVANQSSSQILLETKVTLPQMLIGNIKIKKVCHQYFDISVFKAKWCKKITTKLQRAQFSWTWGAGASVKNTKAISTFEEMPSCDKINFLAGGAICWIISVNNCREIFSFKILKAQIVDTEPL